MERGKGQKINNDHDMMNHRMTTKPFIATTEHAKHTSPKSAEASYTNHCAVYGVLEDTMMNDPKKGDGIRKSSISSYGKGILRSSLFYCQHVLISCRSVT